MTLKNLKNTLAITFIIGFASSVVAEKMYKWQDDKGVVHYTQTAPKSGDFEIIEVAENDTKRGFTPRQSNRQAQATQSVATPQVPKTDVERYKAARNNNCELAKRNLNTLTTVARIRIPDGSGGERLLNDKEKAEKVALTKEQVKTFCAKENDQTLQKKSDEAATNQP